MFMSAKQQNLNLFADSRVDSRQKDPFTRKAVDGFPCKLPQLCEREIRTNDLQNLDQGIITPLLSYLNTLKSPPSVAIS